MENRSFQLLPCAPLFQQLTSIQEDSEESWSGNLGISPPKAKALYCLGTAWLGVGSDMFSSSEV